jgi:hypothetical protein
MTSPTTPSAVVDFLSSKLSPGFSVKVESITKRVQTARVKTPFVHLDGQPIFVYVRPVGVGISVSDDGVVGETLSYLGFTKALAAAFEGARDIAARFGCQLVTNPGEDPSEFLLRTSTSTDSLVEAIESHALAQIALESFISANERTASYG